MNAVRFREAHSDDKDVLWAMLQPVFRAGDTYAIDPDISRDDATAYWLSGRAWLAETDTPCGTFFIRRNQQGGGAHVCNAGFVVASGASGQGVARAMLDHALKEARGLGYLAMQFNFVLETNTRALAIWRRAGFAQIGRQPRAFRMPDGRLVDALVLHKFL